MPDAPQDQHLIETTLHSEKVYDGVLMKVHKDTVRLPNGATSIREFTKHPGAVMLVPVLPNGNYIMERQFRYPLNKVFLEFPAGKMDAGEDPLDTAHRELREETGYVAEKLEYLTTIHPVISYSTEAILLYKAEGLTLTNRQLDDNEFLDVIEVSPADLLEQIRSGEVSDVKTIIGAFWLQSAA